MTKIRFAGESAARFETCLEFRNADLKAFVRHLHERRCQKCWVLFEALREAAAHHEISPAAQKTNEMPAAELRQVPAALYDKSLDRQLVKEYFLIPHSNRPIVGSNDWFRWLDEFRHRHPADVARLTEPLAQRALQVLWNSR